MAQTTAKKSVKVERLSRGWTLEQLAEKCTEAGAPVHFSTIARIEKGAVPRPGLLAVLAELLEMDVTDLDPAA